MPSRGSLIALAASIIFSGGMITYVHFRQGEDLREMRKGVARDMERQEEKKQLQANQRDLEAQIEFTKTLKAGQDELDKARSMKESS